MDFVSKTDVGKRRKKNEDSMYCKKYDEKTALYIVADGLGGYSSGEVASQILIRNISRYVEEHMKILKGSSDETIKNTLKNALNFANNEIYELEKTDEKYDGMGTTAIAVLFIDNKIYYFSVGDSRIYYIDDDMKTIQQITVDDSYVNELLKTNVIDESEVATHPQKHILTKAVGILKSICVNIEMLEKKFGYLLLCTDGMSNMIKNEEVLAIFKKSKFNEIADKLVTKANNNGGIDNITVIAIKY